MKIGITCYPTFGGSGVVATELGLALAKKGHCVHFITYALPIRLNHIPPNVFFHEVQVNIYPLFQYPSYDIALTSKMVDVTIHENLDLLHVHYAIPHATSAYMAKKILESKGKSIKFITTLHGTDITLIGQDPNYIPAVEFSIDKSDGVTSVSSYLKNETNAIFDISHPIEVIPNFVDGTRFKRQQNESLQKRYKPSGERLLIHISNFRPLKRIKDVVDIFDRVKKEIPSKLMLVGDGPERPEIERYCREKGLIDSVFFMGKYESIEELLSIADLFLLTSETETFGLAALEAMACEVPVISTNVGGIPELNNEGMSGFLCDVGDIETMTQKAITILRDDESLMRFRAGALKVAQSFDSTTIVEKYENFYRKILG